MAARIANKGLVIVSSSSGQWKASAPAAVCGSPLHTEPTGDGRWIVATSAGISTVSVDDSGTPALLDAALIWPNGKGELRTRAVDPARLDPACALLDKAVCLGERCEAGRASSALAVRGADALLVPAATVLPVGWFASWLDSGAACGKLGSGYQTPLLWLQHRDGGWGVQDSLAVPGRVRAMRVAGDFAYLNARDGLLGLGKMTTPLVELGKGAMMLAGSHSLADWVDTKGNDDVRVRLKDGAAQLAVLGY